jgi:tetratricopeptide (TPR) repeat protein
MLASAAVRGVSLRGLLEGGDPIVVEEVEHALLVARVERALFGAEGVPLRLGRYHVLEKVGRGGGGTVYRGRDPDLDRVVAIKVVHREGVALAELFGEAQALARLVHPNVVEVYDVFCEPERARVVMILQWIEGSDAETRLRAETPDVDAVLELYRQAGQGLAAAHRAGLVHRDFKPANLLVTDDGYVRVADFGLAHNEGTREHGVAGTPAYMAPELWARAPATARSDQYAYCASLVEALLPGGLPDDLDAALRRRDVPARIRKALARGLAADPRARFDTMDDLLAELVPRRRRFVLPAALALGAVGSLAGFLAPDPAPVLDACSADAAGVGADWDARQADVRRRLASRDAANDADATQRIAVAVTRYADGWADAWSSTCGIATPDTDRRQRCLQGQRWHVAALVDLLATAESDELPRALAAVAALPAPQSCAAPAEAGLSGWMPEGEEARASADAFRRRLAEVTASFAAGRYREGAAEGEALLAEIERMPFEPLALLTRIALARLRALEGRPEVARELFIDAYFDAVRAGRDREAADAATGLVFTVGYQLADAEQGIAWARHADAALRRLQLEGEALAVLLNHRGTIATAQGDLAAARAFHEQALAIREPLANPPALAHTHNNLGNVALHARDLERARDHHARALALRREVYGPSHPIVATSLNNLGSVTMLADGPSAARDTFEQALHAWERGLGPDHPDLLSALHNLTVVAVNEDRLDDAHAFVERARRIAEARLPTDHPSFELVREDEAGLREVESAGRE